MVASGPTQKAPLSQSFDSCFHPQIVFDHTWKHKQSNYTLFTLQYVLVLEMSLHMLTDSNGWDELTPTQYCPDQVLRTQSNESWKWNSMYRHIFDSYSPYSNKKLKPFWEVLVEDIGQIIPAKFVCFWKCGMQWILQWLLSWISVYQITMIQRWPRISN